MDELITNLLSLRVFSLIIVFLIVVFIYFQSDDDNNKASNKVLIITIVFSQAFLANKITQIVRRHQIR